MIIIFYILRRLNKLKALYSVNRLQRYILNMRFLAQPILFLLSKEIKCKKTSYFFRTKVICFGNLCHLLLRAIFIALPSNCFRTIVESVSFTNEAIKSSLP